MKVSLLIFSIYCLLLSTNVPYHCYDVTLICSLEVFFFSRNRGDEFIFAYLLLEGEQMGFVCLGLSVQVQFSVTTSKLGFQTVSCFAVAF